MRFDRKLYMVAMVVFAVLLFTAEVFADMTATIEGIGGTVNPPSAKNYGTFTITPDSEYRVDDIVLYEGVNNLQERGSIFEYCGSVDDKITCSVEFVGMNVVFSYGKLNASYVLIASFEEIPTFTYTASNTSAGPYGVITGPGGVTLGAGESYDFTVYEGSDTTFAITPSEFCQVVDVTVDGTSIGAVPSYTFDNGTSPHSIEATFEAIPVFAGFTATTESGEITTTDEVQFTDGSTGPFTSWEWNFGDGTTLTGSNPLIHKNPTHTYEQAGQYTVTLTVRNAAIFDDANEIFEVSDASSPVIVGHTQVGYKFISEAYQIIPYSGATIKMKSGEITEDLWFNDHVTFDLKGGYDSSYGSDNGYTKIRGNVKISHGEVTVSKVIIAP